MTVRIITGDSREVLRTLPDASVHCVVTSPPYWGLRDYDLPPSFWGGDPDCQHRAGVGGLCGCGAWYGCLGLEPSPVLFIVHLVELFREVYRVLRKDGTMWVNMGDSYATSGGAGWQGKNGQRADRRFTAARDTVALREATRRPTHGMKAKDLVGAPWMLAFALRADGWFLRQDIIWSKRNPMPESVRDRCTRSHEYLFLFAKARHYYYDRDAIMEPSSPASHARVARGKKVPSGWDVDEGGHRLRAGRYQNGCGPKARANAPGSRANESFTAATSANLVARRNKRSVWDVTTVGFAEAHFATFPPALIEPCILAGCPIGGTVLDPFGGAGTTGLVADRLQRDALLIELNPEYAEIARRRIFGEAPIFHQTIEQPHHAPADVHA